MPNFQLLQHQTINALNIGLYVYQHTNTGAMHIHLDAPDNTENGFLLALRTFPEDSTGVAHILEHTTLCGSDKFPVRDPFFLMIRRSLNSFMNAMTSSDWTAYPFATPNKKDFHNLMEVYIDSVFFPKLNELDFAQEGHRLEFEDSNDPNSPLVYKGVVYNEMKGAMSSEISILWDSLCRYLYPTSTYQYNSGGDPAEIPTLSYQQLKAFHAKFYHPTNAIFMTFGDIAATDHQQRFEQLALEHFGVIEPLPETFNVTKEQRYTKPKHITLPYAVNVSEQDEQTNKSHVVKGWLLGESTSIEDTLEAILLGAVLLDDSASPLRQCLENTELGTLSPLCGVDVSQREICMVAGLENCSADKSYEIDSLIKECLASVAEDGIDNDRIQACFRQIELQQREITGDSMPFGLQLLMSCLSSAIHGADIAEHINIDQHLVALREKIKDSEYIKQLCKNSLINNNHSVLLTLEPDTTLNEQRKLKEQSELANIKTALNQQKIDDIIQQTQLLEQRQSATDDVSLLPKVTLDDIAEQIHWANAEQYQKHNSNLYSYPAGTNGVVYLQHLIKLPVLTLEQLELLPIYCYLLTELGANQGDNSYDYLAMQRWQSDVCAGIKAQFIINNTDNDSNVNITVALSSKSLSYQCAKMQELIDVIINGTRFDELDRIKSLIAQLAAQSETGVVGRAHVYAMADASKALSFRAQIDSHLTGIGSVQRIKALSKRIESIDALNAFANELADLHHIIQPLSRDYLIIGETSTVDDYQQRWLTQIKTPNQSAPSSSKQDWRALIDDIQSIDTRHNAHASSDNSNHHFWQINSQVNYCSIAFQTVTGNHKDTPALNIMAKILDNHYLHSMIREKGGAYGGGCVQNNVSASFRFYSYRDPKHRETIETFKQSLIWLADVSIEEQWLEEAKLSIISSLDKPLSPAGFAKHCYFTERHGKTHQDQINYRQAIIQTTADDVKRVLSTYFDDSSPSCSVVGSQQSANELANDFHIHVL